MHAHAINGCGNKQGLLKFFDQIELPLDVSDSRLGPMIWACKELHNVIMIKLHIVQ